MGYFDGLTSTSFKTAQDGRKLFFPWGVLGHGYVLASEQDDARLRRQLKAYVMISLPLIILTGLLAGNLATLAMAGTLVGFHYVWMRWFVLPGLTPSDEKLSLRESTTSQAKAHGPVVLWLLEIFSAVFVGGGIVLFFLDPDDRLAALASICIFGLCTAFFARLLWLRRRTAITGS